jgi:phosphate transport system permease protein
LKSNRLRFFTQNLAKILIWIAALSTIAVMILILFQILAEGLPILRLSFFLESPKSMGREGGIFTTIIGTIALTAVAIIVATPMGVGTAIFLREYTRESRTSRVIRFGTDCLAGVPSIIFGLFGFVFFVIYLNMGWSILSGGLTLAAMILPTIICTTEEAIKTIYSYKWLFSEEQNGRPSSGHSSERIARIFTGIIWCRRSIGETAIILAAGSSLVMPTSLFHRSEPWQSIFISLPGRGSRWKWLTGQERR